MASPDLGSILQLYQRVVVNDVLSRPQSEGGLRPRSGVYSVAVVLWLLILQRLDPKATAASVVERLARGDADPLLQPCKRVREGKMSPATGGYCQARQKLPKLVVSQVNDELIERLRQELSQPWPGLAAPAFVVDGTTLQLQHRRELIRAFPPANNQHGPSHWPILQVVAMHDVASGLAQRPHWGAMYGPNPVSEQALADRAIAALPAGAVVIGDRNFGVFSTAYSAQQYQHPVLLRLTKVRAYKLAGGPISREIDLAVVWTASRWDGRKKARWPDGAAVCGRLIACRVGRGKAKQWLYLFTTLSLPVEQVVALYGQRWNIETDLRSLKRTVHLHQLTAKSLDMMEKELLVACSAYNLVRAVMCLAARQANLRPRDLSFSRVLTVVDYAWGRLMAARSPQEHDREFDRMLARAAACKLPKRRRSRSYPREVWGRGYRFPSRKVGSSGRGKTK